MTYSATRLAMLAMLAPHYDIDLSDTSPERAEAIITKDVYKYTDSGCSVAFYDDHLTLSGYVEGWDGECPAHVLRWPFTAEKFFDELEAADDEAKEIWKQTHGCETCLAHWQDVGADIADSFGLGTCPVWDDCPECDGDGIVI